MSRDYLKVPSPFVWDESFDVGDPEADAQHRKLFALVAAFEAKPNKTTYNDVLNELHFHFKEEEQDLEGTLDKEDAAGHMEEHEKSLEMFAKKKPNKKTVNALKKWLVYHIKTEDMKFKGIDLKKSRKDPMNSSLLEDEEVTHDVEDPEESEEFLPWYKDSNQLKLIVMIFLTMSFMCAEMSVGFITGSLALVSDAFHMIADGISYIIAFIAILWSKNAKSQRYTFGWERSEIVGSFINGVLLLTISLFITLEAIQRFADIPEIKTPLMVVYVASGGVILNLIGMFMFGEMDLCCGDHQEEEDDVDLKKSPSPDKVKKDNIRAVFVHIVGDLVGQLAAIVSGLIIQYLDEPWKYYFDPALSMIIVVILIKHSIPIVRRAMQTFMQRVPKFLKMDQLEKELRSIPEVIDLHELHVWSLAGEMTIASVHVVCLKEANFPKILFRIKEIFHEFGVHSITVQPECVSLVTLKNKHPRCQISCTKKQCTIKPCCPYAVDPPFDEKTLQCIKLGVPVSNKLLIESDSTTDSKGKEKASGSKSRDSKSNNDDMV